MTLTVLQVLEAFILNFELEWVDEQRRIIEDVHGCDVDGRHAVLSGPGSLETLMVGSVRAQCCVCCPAPRFLHALGALSCSPIQSLQSHRLPNVLLTSSGL